MAEVPVNQHGTVPEAERIYVATSEWNEFQLASSREDRALGARLQALSLAKESINPYGKDDKEKLVDEVLATAEKYHQFIVAGYAPSVVAPD